VAVDARSPVIVGAGQSVHRPDDDAGDGVGEGPLDRLGPLELMADAVVAAARDAGLAGIPSQVGSIRVVSMLSYRARNPALLLAERLGVEAAELGYTTAGGNSPQSLVNRTALDIATGRTDLVVLAGAEAWRTRMRARAAGITLQWPRAPEDSTPIVFGDELEMSHPAEAALGIHLPVQVYPMFETAIRAATGTLPDDHLAAIGDLWSRFSDVAATNPHAWNRVPMSAPEILATGPQNRMIGFPYRKVMNSNNDVDMGAALVMCSAERAAALGVSTDRWVFPHAGTDCHEHGFVSHRWSFSETPAIRLGGQRVLELAGTGIDDIDIVDLYSCFPSAVQLGAAALGLGLDRQLTRTGGLSFAGGPWNNYVMHAIATMVRELRGRPDELGLVWANGGYVTKHAFGVYGAAPPRSGFRHDHPQAEIDALPHRDVVARDDAVGPADMESYTVMFGRDGSPEVALASCLLGDGRRAWATSSDVTVAAALLDGEWVGRRVTLSHGVLHV
jgi:acetyl-CoA C-acetyltransferase